MSDGVGSKGARVAPPPNGRPWAVLQMVQWSAQYLAEKGVEGGRLDAEYLLADVLGMGRLDLYLHFDRPLSPEELGRFKPALLARAGRKPLQYILGRAAFRELDLKVDERVLIPRPETEELVEAVLNWSRKVADARKVAHAGMTALDVGTGSGAIALALATEGPFERIVATDISGAALVLAAENAAKTGVSSRIEFRHGSLLDPVRNSEQFDVIVSNLPYIAMEEFAGLAPEVRDWEPREALVAEDRGLALVMALVRAAGAALLPGGLLALEVGSTQTGVVADQIRGTGGFGEPEILRDLSRRDRIVLAVRHGSPGERTQTIGKRSAESAGEPRGKTDGDEREAG